MYFGKRYKLFYAILAIVCSGLFSFFSVSAAAASYKLGLVEWLPWGTAYIAENKGFWKEQGLDIQIKQFQNYETENLSAFENGHTDFMLSMLGNTLEMINRNPDKTIIFENNWSHGGDFFILSKALHSLAAVKGKRIAVYSKSAPIGFFATKVLASANLTINDVKLIEIANTKHLNKAFKAGKFAAIISYEPDASNVIKEGSGKLLFTSADFPGVIPEGISVQKKHLQKNPEDVQKFLRGWLRAIQWQANPANRDEYFKILKQTMFKNTSYSQKELEAFHSGGKFHTDLESIQQNNTLALETYIKELLVFLKQTGRKIHSSNASDYFQTDMALQEAKLLFSVAAE
ncbi:ABC transporter substrate-binding protein [Candidatus Venteria ishoeyi]|uniref:ABC transporter substrate-binding protein n=1 Tax=Candidatus Venteria ishoeyi TaxID=1899563 RepID=UPI0025A5C04A|nr:ABC transporter substrate-binding protein [Candidatus Venteria ishoeyi]MDM8546574.1 ABC transporter substrate-binding protein [Candidatus Venteria ishoeyi]